MAYNEFAYYYDSLMDEAFYEEYKAFILPFLKDRNKILELGCGTGTMSILLALEGKNIIGTDLSEEMVDLATYKADDEGLELQFEVMDMTDFSTDECYDTILCFTDGLNYLNSIESTKKVFKEVHDHLTNDGLWIFDVHAMHKVDVTFKDYHEYEKEDDYMYEWTVHKTAPGTIEHHIIIEEGDNPRVDEIHVQTTYPVEDYIHYLKEAGFNKISYYSDFHNYDPNDDRVIFIVRKGE